MKSRDIEIGRKQWKVVTLSNNAVSFPVAVMEKAITINAKCTLILQDFFMCFTIVFTSGLLPSTYKDFEILENLFKKPMW